MNKIATLILICIAGALLFIVFRPEGQEQPTASQSAKEETPKILLPGASTKEAAIPLETVDEVMTEEKDGVIQTTNEPTDREDNNQISETDRQAITTFLSDWKTAWQQSAGKGSSETYLSFYSDHFQTDRYDKKGWGESKKKTNARKEWIHILLNNITIEPGPAPGTYQVSFSQNYSSSNYSETGGKVLILEKTNDGFAILTEK